MRNDPAPSPGAIAATQPSEGRGRPRMPLALREIAAVLQRDRAAQVGLVLIGLLILLALLAPLLAPHDPLAVDVLQRLQAPSRAHLLGTDQVGRDQLSRMLYGARISLAVGPIAVALAASVGVILGLVGGYAGGFVDNAIMRVMDALLAFPGLLLALVIVSTLGPGLMNTLIAFAVGGIPRYARLLRSLALSVRTREYVVAARATGAGSPRIMLRHVLPNSASPVLIAVTLHVGATIVGIASLSYLGLGIQPPTPEWGAMLSGSQTLLFRAPWLLFSPGIAILVAVVAFNLLGEGLRDALDPRLRGNAGGRTGGSRRRLGR